MSARTLGKYERLFHERQARDLELTKQRGGHPLGFVYSHEIGDHVVKFIEKYCRHHKGEWAGQRLILEEWQKEVIRVAFGWQMPDPEKRGQFKRRFTTIYVEIPRKNGKSEVAAAIGLYLTMADGEEGAEVYSSATKKDQARIVWKAAAEMVNRSPKLKERAKAFKGSIVVDKTSSTFQPLGADSSTLDGLNPHGNIIDELHAHKDRGVWDVLDSAMGARRQPVTLAITTAGVLGRESIGYEMHDYAVKVLEGTIADDDKFFAFIAAADEGDDYFSEATLAKANPNFGVSAKRDYLMNQAKKAQRQPGFLNEYLVKHLNVWTQQAKRWLPLDKWNSCEPQVQDAAEVRRLAVAREGLLTGRECRGGLDLSSKLDLSALVLEFPLPDDCVELVCRFWLPEARVAEEAAKGKRHYETWVKQGWLKVTPGNAVDYEFIRKDINDLVDGPSKFVIKELGFDPWNGRDLATRLMGDGLNMIELRQSYQVLSEPCKDLEAKVVEGKVRHMNNPVMRWCASNAVVIMDANGNIRPDKAKAADRIDGIVAWAMARSRGIVAPKSPPPAAHPYSGERGFRSL